jgi:hypothetical protein
MPFCFINKVFLNLLSISDKILYGSFLQTHEVKVNLRKKNIGKYFKFNISLAHIPLPQVKDFFYDVPGTVCFVISNFNISSCFVLDDRGVRLINFSALINGCLLTENCAVQFHHIFT